MNKTQTFIEKASKLHDNKYDYSKVNYIKAIEKVIIICKIHGEFLQSPNNHLKKILTGCPKCGMIKRINSQSSNNDEFIKNAIIIHGHTYDYSKVNYINAKDKVIIICKRHGEFLQSPTNHLSKKGCQQCGQNRTAIKKTNSTENFIIKANKIHNNKYDYSQVNYIKAIEKVIIICKIHGEFLQTPHKHLSKNGCSKCSINNHILRRTDNTTIFIQKAINTHGNTYDYSLVEYIKSNKKVIIICKIHGKFLQTPANHINGNNCIKCTYKNYSKPQILWLDFISKLNNIYIQHIGNSNQEFKIPTTRYLADGYCKETNTIYEFHGDFFHGNPKIFKSHEFNTLCNKTYGELYKKTILKEQKIKRLGFNLIIIWESEWNYINKCIKILQLKFRNR
jgi:predicted  nucleic acid-binding Zn-ribbon protein